MSKPKAPITLRRISALKVQLERMNGCLRRTERDWDTKGPSLFDDANELLAQLPKVEDLARRIHLGVMAHTRYRKKAKK